MKATTQYAAAAAILIALAWPSQLLAQDNSWSGGPAGNWIDGTWTAGGAPDPALDARGVVGSTVGSATPTAVVSVTSDIRVSNPSPTVVLGNGAGTSGTLNITSTGKFRVPNVDLSTGNFDVGLNSGTGVLNVATGGVLEVARELRTATSGNAASTISLAGTANVTAGSAFFDRRLVVDGSSVNFNVSGNSVFGQAGTHTWRIGASGASTLKVAGNADLGGTLRLEFPSGTPTVGSIWNIIDSDTVDAGEATPSGFNNVDQSGVAGLVPGARFNVSTAASGSSVNGIFTRLSLEQHPVLMVNRATGAMSLRNFGASPTVSFDTYAITSALGALNPAAWTSLAPATGWVEANPSTGALSEVNVSGSGTVNGLSTISLGNAFNRPAPTSFGQQNEDLVFRFAKPGGGFINGQVMYTGIPNDTLTLNVDPDTGEAQIVNGTSFTVSIDTYAVTSATNSLKFANGLPANTWNSLDDQNTTGGNWKEANPSAGQISELLIDGGLTLAPNARVNIGSPFDDVSGIEDLVFRFALTSSDASGDFNADGRVDGGDVLSWQRNLGAPNDSSLNGNGDDVGGVTGGDLAVWKSRFGATTTSGPAGFIMGKVVYSPLVVLGSTTAAAVPEPASAAMLMSALSLAIVGLRRRG